MDNEIGPLVYFVNSRGKRAVLQSPENSFFFELGGRTGFAAPNVEPYTEKMASGTVKYFGKNLKPRECSMKFICKGRSEAETDELFYDILDTLLDAGGNGEGRLYVRTSDGTMALLNCIYTGGASIVESYKRFKKFTLTFYATDPYFYTAIPYDMRDIYLNRNQMLTIDNPKSSIAPIEMLIADNTKADAYLFYMAEGSFRNLTTGKKVTFSNYGNPYGEGIRLDGYIQMKLKFSDKSYELYLEDGRGNRTTAWQCFDWEESDLDFYAVPGRNVIYFDVSASQRFEFDSTVYIMQRRVGI